MKFMKKLAAVLLVLALCMSAALASMVSATAYVNIRKGPDFTQELLDTAYEGERFIYLDESQEDARGREWYKIEYGDGEYGWITSKYSQLVSEPELMSTDTISAMDADCTIYAGASAQAEQVGTLKQGSTAKVLGDMSTDESGTEWVFIRYRGITGWIASNGIAFGTAPEVPEPTPLPKAAAKAPSKPYVQTKGGARSNLRKIPDIDSTILCVLHAGEYAKYLNEGEVDDRGVMWYKVKFNGVTGWVSEKYTELIL